MLALSLKSSRKYQGAVHASGYKGAQNSSLNLFEPGIIDLHFEVSSSENYRRKLVTHAAIKSCARLPLGIDISVTASGAMSEQAYGNGQDRADRAGTFRVDVTVL